MVTTIKIKTGKTGRQPTATRTIWTGSAAVLVYGEDRVPAALVETDCGVMAVVQLAGNGYPANTNRWWDARCVPSREWEDANGELLSGGIAQQIDEFLGRAAASHERTSRDLNLRVSRGEYAVAD